MKKKIKSKSKNRAISKVDTFFFWFFNILWILIVIFNLALFYKSFNASLTKNGETPIATITFKYRTAQRRFEERNLWDRLKQNSPVYNGDTIRTEKLSEATVHFIDGNEISLMDNSMTQIFLKGTNLEAELFYGNMTADSSESEGNIQITKGNSKITVDKDSAVSIKSSSKGSEEDNLFVQATKGSVLFSSNGEDAVEIKEGESANLNNKEENKVISKNLFTLLSPKQNEKFINQTNKKLSVDFEIGTSKKSNFKIQLQLSKSENMKSPYNEVQFENETKINAEVEDGISYYKITINEDEAEYVTTGRIMVVESSKPILIAPVENYELNYRKKYPTTRFLWSESKNADTYRLEISDTKDFSNVVLKQQTFSTSSIISSIGEGKWYWKVTPFYSIGKIGFFGESEISSFEVKRKDELISPTLKIPNNSEFVNTKENSKDTIFSWKSDSEAMKYTLLISDNNSFENAKFKIETEQNFFSVNPAKLGLSDGKWYWTVKITDFEGNISDIKEIREFIAIKGEIIQRTVYPPNGYSVAENLLRDLRFTWKSNIPFETQFQLSKNQDFTEIIKAETTGDGVLSGLSESTGKYYWRIYSLDKSSGIEFATEPKELNILEPLDRPECITPNENKKAIVRYGKPCRFEWKKIEDAHYYKVIVKNLQTNQVIFEQNLISENHILINLDGQSEGLYSWSVQPFSFETEMCSRRSGYLGETKFALRRIHPVELIFPRNLDELDGKTSILTPRNSEWTTKDSVGYATIIIKSKNGNFESRLTNAKPNEKMPRLRAGEYYWTVKAFTTDEIDISSEKINSFTVLPIEPIPNTKIKHPLDKAQFEDDYFFENSKISFEWEKVDEATHYLFKFTSPNGKTLLEKKIEKDTKIDFTDIQKLQKGNFKWSVEAVNCLEDGEIFQESTIQEAEFDIVLSDIYGKSKKAGTMYNKLPKKKK